MMKQSKLGFVLFVFVYSCNDSLGIIFLGSQNPPPPTQTQNPLQSGTPSISGFPPASYFICFKIRNIPSLSRVFWIFSITHAPPSVQKYFSLSLPGEPPLLNLRSCSLLSNTWKTHWFSVLASAFVSSAWAWEWGRSLLPKLPGKLAHGTP